MRQMTDKKGADQGFILLSPITRENLLNPRLTLTLALIYQRAKINWYYQTLMAFQCCHNMQ